MGALGYQSGQYTVPAGFVNPISAAPDGGCQQAASNGVIGSDANVTVSLPYQGVGLPVVPSGATAFTPFDGSIP
jgi:hypothetical protein